MRMLDANVALLGAVAGFTIFLGMPVARMGSLSARVRSTLNSIAVGILLFLLIEVVKHGWEPVECTALGEPGCDGGAPVAATFGALFVGGLLAGLLLLVWIEHRYIRAAAQTRNGEPTPPKGSAPSGASLSLALMIAIGIGFHNFSEGLAIGSQAAAGALVFATVLAVGFALHNATEGFGIAAPLTGTKPEWGFLLKTGLIGGGPTFLGTLVGSVYTNEYLSVLFLALAAGTLIYVIKELLNLSKYITDPKDVYFSMAGIAVGLLLGLSTEMAVEFAAV